MTLLDSRQGAGREPGLRWLPPPYPTLMHLPRCYTPHLLRTIEVERKTVNVHTILQELKSEGGRIDQAIKALESLNNNLPKAQRVGRPKAAAPKNRARRRLSAAGRAKLARLMKQRWAARKKAGKTTLA